MRLVFFGNITCLLQQQKRPKRREEEEEEEEVERNYSGKRPKTSCSWHPVWLLL
jgi:hypothetical protein